VERISWLELVAILGGTPIDAVQIIVLIWIGHSITAVRSAVDAARIEAGQRNRLDRGRG
jgi:hypothetical protein